MASGGNQILYNLAFSPKISYLDFSETNLCTNDAAEAIYKLIKISGSIETLLFKDTGLLSYYNKEEYFKAIGESKTLAYLDLSNKKAQRGSHITASVLTLLGKACAMNAKKNGCLKFLGLANLIQSELHVSNYLMRSFKISDQDEENWYGEAKIAKEMKKEQLEK